jgi:hypothetical protein
VSAEPARPDPERLLLVPRLETAGGPRYLLVCWRDWPPPALLSLQPPAEPSALRAAVAETLEHRIGVRVVGEPAFSGDRRPARMQLPSRGGEGMGWLRAAAVRVEGEPTPDSLLESVLALPLEDALAAVTSDVERELFRRAAALLEGA